jgi:hypothetical protein
MTNLTVITSTVSDLRAAAFAKCRKGPNALCDKAVKEYCHQVGSQLNDPVCGCVNSPSTNPMCNDSRCTSSSAYRPTGWVPICPNAPITCAEWALLDSGKHVDSKAILPAGGCGAPQSALPITNTVMIVFMIILVAVLALIVRRNAARGTDAGRRTASATFATSATSAIPMRAT